MNTTRISAAARVALRIVAIYILAGGIWILSSDRLLELLVSDRQLLSRLALFKGWAYVALTALLLFGLIRRYLLRQQELDHELLLNRETIERSADAVFWTDRTGRIVYSNAAATRKLGYSAEELRSMTVHDLAPGFPAEVWPEHWQELKEKGSKVFEAVQRHKDGSPLEVEISTNYIRHGDEEYTAAFSRDIGERNRTNAALLAAESRYRDLLESVHLLAVILDRECRIVFCNDYLLGMSGWTREELIGRNWFEAFVPEDELSRVREVNSSILEENIVPHFENHILTKGGERRLIVWNNTVLRDPDGTVSGSASIGVDVTEHRRVEQERRQLELQVQQAQKLESLGLMAGGIAHDFNNILSAVIGNAELASNHLGSCERAEAYLERVRTAAGKAAELARQMLAYSGRSVLVVTRVDLNSLLGSMRTTLQSTVSHQVSLMLEYGSSLPIIDADVFQLRQVITNLLVNACEAIGEDSGTIVIATGSLECGPGYLNESWPPDSQLPPGHYVFLDVSDSGCGMPPETVARLFDPFFSTKFVGRGLGMAAVLGIVRGHGGCIRVDSLPGAGTTFRLLFPIPPHTATP